MTARFLQEEFRGAKKEGIFCSDGLQKETVQQRRRCEEEAGEVAIAHEPTDDS
jgi:hypothetical protein